MPSRADATRVTLERTLRAVALAAAAVLAARAWTTRDTRAVAVASRAATADSALARWTVDAPPRIHWRADQLPTRAQREWLIALRRAGAVVSWRPAEGAAASALIVDAEPSPSAESRVSLVAPSGSGAPLRDRLGNLDSLTVGDSRIAWFTGAVAGAARATLPGAALVSAARDSVVLRPVLVAGVASWETKFVIAALEEAGWEVRAHIAVAPTANVGGGGAMRIDTAALGAVVVLDSAVAPAPAVLRRFVESGGGVVIAGSGARARGYTPLLPGSAPRRDPARVTPPSAERPRASIAASVFHRLSDDAVALERRAGGAVLVARRLGAGRILLSGYDETWRWRMTGEGDDAPDAHRAWWSSMVSAVAYAPRLPRPTPWLDEAPLAATASALGDPLIAADARPATRRIPDAWLFASLVLALLAEWLSRRLRGAR